VKTVLLVAMYSEQSDQRSLIVEKVGLNGARAIADCIQEMEDDDERSAIPDATDTEDTGSEIDLDGQEEVQALSREKEDDGRSPPPAYERDPELEREEKLIAALQEKRKLEEKLAYLEDDLKDSETQRRALEEEVQESRFGLGHRRRTTMDEESFLQLNVQVDRDRDYIAKLESDLVSAQDTLETQQRQLQNLNKDAQSKQDLRDELQLTKSELNDLRQKSKANENLKKKIQALQETERQNIQMRKDLQNVQEQLAEVDRLRDRCSALEKANEENAKTIANGEQEIFDQKTAKEQLKYEIKVLGQRFEQTREMLQASQEQVREMEDRGPTAENGDEAGADLDLDMELNAEPGTAADEAAKRAAKRKSLAAASQSGDMIVLQQNLTIAQGSIARLEQRCLDLLQENLGFKSELRDEDSPFQHQIKRLEGLQKDVEDAQARHIAATSEVADLRRLLELSESSAWDAREKSEDEVIKENRERQRYIEELQTQLGEHRGLLRHALLGTEALLKESEELRKGEDYKIVRLQLEAVRDAVSTEQAESVLETTALNITNRISSSLTLLEQRDEKLHALTTELDKLKALPPTAAAPPAEVSKDAKEEVEILKRENKLMASAWYDLTSRLQSNTIMLSRRQEVPKSWLGRQRVAVGSTPRR
jgi:protein HOOK3